MISEYPFDSELSSNNFANKQLRVNPAFTVRVSRCAARGGTTLCKLRPYLPLVAEDEGGIERSR